MLNWKTPVRRVNRVLAATVPAATAAIAVVRVRAAAVAVIAVRVVMAAAAIAARVQAAAIAARALTVMKAPRPATFRRSSRTTIDHLASILPELVSGRWQPVRADGGTGPRERGFAMRIKEPQGAIPAAFRIRNWLEADGSKVMHSRHARTQVGAL